MCTGDMITNILKWKKTLKYYHNLTSFIHYHLILKGVGELL